MKKALFIVSMAVILGFSTLTHAALVDNGNGLIYDTDLNITWYDYTNSKDFWSNQMSWAQGLNVGGVTGWRLPSTVDGQFVFSLDGTGTGGYKNVNSEMGHLYYTELGNKAYYDVNGNFQPDFGLKNIGPFTNLLPKDYWSGTAYALINNEKWDFDFSYGYQGTSRDDIYTSYVAIAVHDGNVGNMAVPEGESSIWFTILCLAGILGLSRTRTFRTRINNPVV